MRFWHLGVSVAAPKTFLSSWCNSAGPGFHYRTNKCFVTLFEDFNGRTFNEFWAFLPKKGNPAHHVQCLQHTPLLRHDFQGFNLTITDNFPALSRNTPWLELVSITDLLTL